MIDFVGRNDAQEEVRGYRIELPEVENVIREFPEVKDVTVQAFDSDVGERMMEFQAGNYERFCSRELFRMIHTPHEHDLMMDNPSLDIIVA